MRESAASADVVIDVGRDVEADGGEYVWRENFFWVEDGVMGLERRG
jgi:hypothetical protein